MPTLRYGLSHTAPSRKSILPARIPATMNAAWLPRVPSDRLPSYRGRKGGIHGVRAKAAELVLEMLFRFRGNIAAATLLLEFSDELGGCCHLTIVAEFALRQDGATNSFCDRRKMDTRSALPY